MRRKSERAATKKGKSSPEKKLEKAKRTRTKRRKSTSSEDESAEESSPVPEVKPADEVEVKPPQTPVKQDSPEESQDQVWHVKATESSGDVGEIKKLKICLTRPPSTPERVDRSPRSRRKHSRATSSSDTPSVEGPEERKKSKHRSKRANRESKDDSDKNQDSQGDEPELEHDQSEEKSNNEISQSTEIQQATVSDQTPVSTTNEEVKQDNEKSVDSTADETSQNKDSGDNETQNKPSDADTTVASPKSESHTEEQGDQSEANTSTDNNTNSKAKDNSMDKTSGSEDKSEVLDIHDEDTKEPVELSSTEEEKDKSKDKDQSSGDKEVSITEEQTDNDNSISQEPQPAKKHNVSATNDPDVVEIPESVKKGRTRNMSTDSEKEKDVEESTDRYRSREIGRSNSTQSAQEETILNGQPPIVVSRKRRWGARPKLTTQKSITISTDILKEIIPDVKPVEFNEVIEEKRHHKREVTEKIECPILPKIIIDNTENMEQHRKDHEDKEKENIKVREHHLSMNRKISIVKDNDSIIARPPSPPRHKQSNILYITNLVRPFTLPQLKNLLQRTGRISENGFWIDRIKSKCFVKYETEDQAVETRHALHGVTWPVSNPKALQVDFSSQEAFDKAKLNEDTDNAQTSTIPGTVEDWLREQDMKRERGEIEKPWERKAAMREWDVGKNDKDKEKEKERLRREDRPLEKNARRHRTPDRSPEPAKKFKKKEEEAPAKLLDDLFRKTKITPCIYWLPLSAETIAIKEEQRRQHMAEHERRLQELRRTQHRRH